MPEEREDVETTLEQGTRPDASQQKGKWRAIDRIAGSTLVVEVLLSIIWAIVWAYCCHFEHPLQVYLALVLFILTGGYLTLIFCPIFKKDNDPRWFHARILSSGIVGGSYAFLLPVVMSLPEGSVNSGGAAALRQAILLATGGLIALIALGETRRKNDNDREAAENLRVHQENMLIQQKEQFEANAFKERKAERRERYTKAIEQLGDEKSSVRMGGVYTLVGLVDEWLEEESIRKYEDRLKEGQVIINNLCAYIRSPFTLASHYAELMQDTLSAEGVYQNKVQEFYADKATLNSEADVRLGIIKEIHDRLRGPKEKTPGTWSDFEYDFSGSTFFYPINLTKSYYKKPVNFSGSTYQSQADFHGSTYQSQADFRNSIYKSWTNFSGSTYQGEAGFGSSTYQGEADFRRSSYKGGADFRRSTYQDWAGFGSSIYQGEAGFGSSIYQGEADFRRSTYKGWTDFGGSTYQSRADFRDSTYKGGADFRRSTYQGWAGFGSSTYKGWTDFSRSTYKGWTDFSGSIFYQKIYFGEDGDINSFSRFTDCTPQFYNEKSHQNALFGSHNNDFTVDIDKGYPIDLDSEGIPLNCKFLTPEQKEFLKGKIQEIEKINNKLFEVKYLKEKEELSKKLQALNEELHKWREEVTTV